jgi:KDO2-lipid IV(A) lauroyltransferase
MLYKRRTLRKEVGRALLTAVLRGLVGPVRRTPFSRLPRLARRLAWLVRVLAPSRQRMARENMRRILGERYPGADFGRLAATATFNALLTGLELLKLPAMRPEEVLSVTRIEGLDYLEEALAQGRGCLMLTAHFGAWELGGAALAARGIPMSVIGSFSSRAALLVNEAREAMGIEVIEADDLRGMLRALRRGRCLAILPDLSHLARNSIVVDFMGQPALTAVGVPLMAQRVGCPVVPGFSYREADGTCRVRLFPALELVASEDPAEELRANAALFNRVIGEQIFEAPEQWLWLHNRWKRYSGYEYWSEEGG